MKPFNRIALSISGGLFLLSLSLAFFQRFDISRDAIPLGDRFELWFMGKKDGWHLARPLPPPRSGVSDRLVGCDGQVHRVAFMDDSFILDFGSRLARVTSSSECIAYDGDRSIIAWVSLSDLWHRTHDQTLDMVVNWACAATVPSYFVAIVVLRMRARPLVKTDHADGLPGK